MLTQIGVVLHFQRPALQVPIAQSPLGDKLLLGQVDPHGRLVRRFGEGRQRVFSMVAFHGGCPARLGLCPRLLTHRAQTLGGKLRLELFRAQAAAGVGDIDPHAGDEDRAALKVSGGEGDIAATGPQRDDGPAVDVPRGLNHRHLDASPGGCSLPVLPSVLSDCLHTAAAGKRRNAADVSVVPFHTAVTTPAGLMRREGPLDFHRHRLLPRRAAEGPHHGNADLGIAARVEHFHAVDVVLGREGEHGRAPGRHDRIRDGLERKLRLRTEAEPGGRRLLEGCGGSPRHQPQLSGAGGRCPVGGEFDFDAPDTPALFPQQTAEQLGRGIQPPGLHGVVRGALAIGVGPRRNVGRLAFDGSRSQIPSERGGRDRAGMTSVVSARRQTGARKPAEQKCNQQPPPWTASSHRHSTTSPRIAGYLTLALQTPLG